MPWAGDELQNTVLCEEFENEKKKDKKFWLSGAGIQSQDFK